MHITGIIAEYNPFHNGHKYHLEETRRITGADYCIAVISGDFMQRGTPAVIDKHTRAKMALQNGADLVLELPLYYAAGSAEFFAHGAITLLNRLGAVDSLCFGSECGSISVLSEIAFLLVTEPEDYRHALQNELRNGHSFPKARSLALRNCLPDTPTYAEAISSPNNILGIEYLKALIKNNSRITPYTIKRIGSGYHDTSLNLSAKCKTTEQGIHDKQLSFSSASAIRTSIAQEGIFSDSDSPELNRNAAQRNMDRPTLSNIKEHVPDSVYDLLSNHYNRSFPISANDFSGLLHYRLLLQAPKGFTDYLDVTADLSDKILKNLYRFEDFEQFCSLLKSKDMTYSRLSRSLLHILLDMTDRQMQEWQSDAIYYARILGFRKSAAPLLRTLKAHTSIPLISKLADASSYLSPAGLSMLEKDIQAAHIYDSVVASKFHAPFINEYSKRLVITE